MSLKDDYEVLISLPEYSLEDIRLFKTKALNNRDDFYLRKGELLLVRYYEKQGELNLALDLIKNNIDALEYRKDKENYREFIDEAIYCAINLKDYHCANKYLNIKKDIIDSEDKDSINRYYLENAYLASLMNQMTKAVENLKIILNNQPSLSMKSWALGNITKLYLAEKKPNEALEYLNQAVVAAQELNDESSLRYCDYLSIKLALLEHDTESAQSGFEAFFKNEHWEDEYLEFYNDYLNFLIEHKEISKASKCLKKYKDRYTMSNDKYLKRDFLLTQINLFINMTKDSPISQEAKQCLKNYIELEHLIELEDKTLEDTVEVKTTAPKASLAVEFQGFKAALGEHDIYQTMLSLMLKFDASFGPLECQAIFFDKNDSNNLKTYSYKAHRCFNRDVSIAKLSNSVFEQILGNPKMIYGKLNPGNTFMDPFTSRLLIEEGYEQLIAYPLFFNDTLTGAICFLYKMGVELDKSKRDSLDVLTTLLAFKYASLELEHDYRNLMLYYNDLFDLDRPLFYYNIEQHSMKLSLPLKQFLNVTDNQIDRNDYLNHMIVDMNELNEAHLHMAHQEDYMLHYTYKNNDKVYLLEEDGYKLTQNTYRCTIKEVEPLKAKECIGTSDEYHRYLKLNSNNHFTVINMILPDNVKLDDLINLSHVYYIYKVKRYLRVIIETYDLKVINGYFKTIKECYPYIKYTYIRYPKDVDDTKLIECGLNYLLDYKEINHSFERKTLIELDQFYRSIDTCRDLKAVSLQCGLIKDHNDFKGYLIRYNLPGLYLEYDYINTHHHEFYDLVVQHFKDYHYDEDLYWMIPTLCLKDLLKTDAFKNNLLANQLKLIIQDDLDLEGLRALGKKPYELYIASNVLHSLTLNDLDSLPIKGIYYSHKVDERDHYLIQEKHYDILEKDMILSDSIDFN